MVTLTLYTPGHGEPMETLILNGLVTSMLEADPYSKFSIFREGFRYRVEVRSTNTSGSDVVEVALNCIEEDAKLGRSLSKIELANSPQPVVGAEKILKEVWLAEGMDVFEEFSNENHSYLTGEGRGSRRKGRKITPLIKAHVPIAPFGGAYMQFSYISIGTTGRAAFQGPTDYVACPLCVLLAWVGMINTTSIIASRTRNTIRVLFSTPAPIRADQDDIAVLYTIFGEKVEVYDDVDIPILATPLLTLSTGETIFAVFGVFNMVFWSFNKQRTFIGVRDLNILPLNPLLDFIANAKLKSPNLPRIVQAFVQKTRGLPKSEPELISMLSEALLFGNYSAYDIVRSWWSALERRGRLRLLDSGLVNTINICLAKNTLKKILLEKKR